MNKDYTSAAYAMGIHGGAFLRTIAQAWFQADATNKLRLEAAFRAEFDKYDEIAKVTV